MRQNIKMEIKYEALEFDMDLADQADDVNFVILSQFPDWGGEKISAGELFMPEHAQDEMAEYIKARFDLSDKDISWLKLDRFPSSCEFRRPECTCPILDNIDAGKHMYFDVNCPVHKK